MNVLIIGSGAREHALGWKISQSKLSNSLIFAPGNAGTRLLGTNLGYQIPKLGSDPEVWQGYFDQILRVCRSNEIALVVIQNESPLSHGMVDFLTNSGILVFGPTKQAAQIESNKIWATLFAADFNIPVPGFIPFTYPQELESGWLPKGFRVVKKNGLAEGKGVVVASSETEADKIVDQFLREGHAVLVQEFLSGQEISAHAFTDGTNVSLTPLSFDYKKIGVGNTGENTGGVGSYSTPEDFSKRFVEISRLTSTIVQSIGKVGRKFKGVIFPGLIQTTDESLNLLEVNCRLGDPETQVLLPRLKSDLLEVMLAIVQDELHFIPLEWEDNFAVCVVLCSRGYPDPDKTEVGFPISGLDQVPEDVLVFHAGTKVDDSGQVVTSGGRVLSVVATGETLEKARNKVYEAIEKVNFEGKYFRDDIALDV